jgi:hypothetical protein
MDRRLIAIARADRRDRLKLQTRWRPKPSQSRLLKFAVDRSKRPVVGCQINQRDKRPAGSERRGCWEQ